MLLVDLFNENRIKAMDDKKTILSFETDKLQDVSNESVFVI